jgi:hypothetical protein
VKARGVKYMAKTFTLPDVQVGSLLEYYYTEDLAEYQIINSHWILSNELFTKKAKFTLNPYTSNYMPINLRWSWNQLPPGTVAPAQASSKVVSLEAPTSPRFRRRTICLPKTN